MTNVRRVFSYERVEAPMTETSRALRAYDDASAFESAPPFELRALDRESRTRRSPREPAARRSARPNEDKLGSIDAPMNVRRRGFGQTRWSLVLRAGGSSSPQS